MAFMNADTPGSALIETDPREFACRACRTLEVSALAPWPTIRTPRALDRLEQVPQPRPRRLQEHARQGVEPRARSPDQALGVTLGPQQLPRQGEVGEAVL